MNFKINKKKVDDTQENICAVGAGPLERLSRPEVPKEIACAECHKCDYIRTGDFCFF